MKKRSEQCLLSIDPSLTSSGWALFGIKSKTVYGVGCFKTLPSSHGLESRLSNLQHRLESFFSSMCLGAGDILICEAPTSMKDPNNVIKVEQVRSLFETLARARQMKVPGRINPRSIHIKLLGLKGAQLKREYVKAAARTMVSLTFSDSLKKLNFDVNDNNMIKHQDIVDALLIGVYAQSMIQDAEKVGCAIEYMFNRR
jgi:Holliday junction resolvasome RuvABC endonuclease subunit